MCYLIWALDRRRRAFQRTYGSSLPVWAAVFAFLTTFCYALDAELRQDLVCWSVHLVVVIHAEYNVYNQIFFAPLIIPVVQALLFLM